MTIIFYPANFIFHYLPINKIYIIYITYDYFVFVIRAKPSEVRKYSPFIGVKGLEEW